MPNPGYLETRQAVADALKKDSGLDFTGAEVIMSCGAAAAANGVRKTRLKPGDEGIILSPYFAEYRYYIDHQS